MTASTRTATDIALEQGNAVDRDYTVDHHELVGQIKDKIAALVLLFPNPEDEYVQKGIVRALCYHADRQVTWYGDKLREQGQKLARMAQRSTGNEIDQERLEKAVDWTRRLESSLDLSRDVLEAASTLHDHMFAEDWKSSGPVDPGMALSKATTAAQQEALMLAMRYRPAQKHLPRGVKGRNTDARHPAFDDEIPF